MIDGTVRVQLVLMTISLVCLIGHVHGRFNKSIFIFNSSCLYDGEDVIVQG